MHTKIRLKGLKGSKSGMLFSIYKKISSYFICNCLIFKRAENRTRTRDPQLGKSFIDSSDRYLKENKGWFISDKSLISPTLILLEFIILCIKESPSSFSFLLFLPFLLISSTWFKECLNLNLCYHIPFSGFSAFPRMFVMGHIHKPKCRIYSIHLKYFIE